ncbi:MAG: DUF1926 domain-containing protein, partial [Candidatus Marinimicrobia bacterium]|nr:DUF1926 domain-containing protein [Candidatus Neomarinimicrobiota bacterium]
AVIIEKQLELHHNTLSVKIRISNRGDLPLHQNYGLEFNFGLLGGDSPDRYFLLNNDHAGHLNTQGDDANIDSLSLVNEWDNFKLELNFSLVCQLWRAPIETVTMSEAGFERVYQASSILPHWTLDLEPGESFRTEFVLSIDKFK